PSLHDSGVVAQQTTTLLSGGQVTRVTQRISSVDGRAHSVDALFAQSAQAPAGGTAPGFQFPGQPTVATHSSPDSFSSFPRGPGSIVVISDARSSAAISNP